MSEALIRDRSSNLKMSKPSEGVNPIKLFFNTQNAKQLYSYIQRGLREQYDVNIDDRYNEQLIKIMKMVIEPLPKKIPADVDPKWFVRTLNQQTLKEALPIFADIAKGNTAPPAPGEKDLALAGHHALSRGNVAPGDARMGRLGATQSTPINNVSVDEVAYQNMMNQRLLQQQAPQTPNFADPEMDYPDDVNDLYEYAEQERHRSDIQQPPNVNMELPFDAMAGFMVRNNPTDYATPEPAELLERSGGVFNPDALDVKPPVSTERLNRQTVRPLIRADQASSDLDFAARNGQNLVGQSSFNDIAPQPAQMRVLIPKTSRNLVHDSNNIPHIFVVNSASDRNSAVYPSASSYRMQLRDQYLDVVSVELTRALIPLSTFNVNENNNVILFQEVDGVTQQAVIPVGNYPDIDTLAMAVAASMTAASAGGVTYTHAVNMLTGKVTLTSDGFGGAIFNLVFFGTPSLEGEGTVEFKKEKPQYPSGSIGPVVGYDSLDYTGDLMYEAPFVPNLAGDSTVYIHVDELELLESNNPCVHDAFAEIDLVGPGLLEFARFEPRDTNRFIKYFSPPKGKLANLTISLRDSEGRLIDFNGRNHILTFEVITKDKTQSPYQEPAGTVREG